MQAIVVALTRSLYHILMPLRKYINVWRINSSDNCEFVLVLDVKLEFFLVLVQMELLPVLPDGDGRWHGMMSMIR